MKKYLVAAFIAFVGVFSVHAQVDKTIEVSDCTPSNLTVEGSTLISKGYGHLVFPEMDYTNYTGFQFEASNFEKLEDNATSVVCSIKIEYLQNGDTEKVTMGIYRTGKKKIDFKSFKAENVGTVSIDPATITKVSIGMGKNKKLDIKDIVLVGKK